MASSITTANTSWVTPYTFTTGELITKSTLDTYISAQESALKNAAGWSGTLDETVVDFSTSSTSFVAISATYLTATITTGGGDVLVGFTGSWRVNTNATGYMDILLDGVQVGTEDGLVAAVLASGNDTNVALVARIHSVSAASHSFALAWKTSANTLLLRSGFASSLLHSIFWGMEIGTV